MDGWLLKIIWNLVKYFKGTNHVNNPEVTFKSLVFTIVLARHNVSLRHDYVTVGSLTFTGVKKIVHNLSNN